MTVSSQTSSVSYAGDGVTAIFAVPFYFLENTHISVIIRDSAGVESVLVLNTDYTVSGAGNQAGGSVTIPSEPQLGETVTIVRSVPATQETDYVENDPFPAESHERALDKLTMLFQQGEFADSRSIRVPDSDPIPSRLPSAQNRAGKLMSFDEDGNPVAIAPSSGSATDLELRLADDTDPSNGAGMVGYKGRTLFARLGDFVSLKDFGAVGNGVDDDAPALREAITFCTTFGHTLYAPSGEYRLISADPAPGTSAIATITNRIRIICENGSAFTVDPAIGSTTDFLAIVPAIFDVEGVWLEGLRLYNASGTPGRDALRISLSSTRGLKFLRIHGCLFRSTGSGRAISVLNSPGDLNPNGLLALQATSSEFYGGMLLENLGDSCSVLDSIFSGANRGIEVSMLPPTGPSGPSYCLEVSRCNFTSTGGAILVHRAACMSITQNNIEQLVSIPGQASISCALVDFDTSGVSVIENNKIMPADGVGLSNCSCISLFQSKNTIIRGNVIAAPQDPTGTFGVILVECDGVKVRDNDIKMSTNATGVRVADAATKNTVIVGNRFTSISTGTTSILDLGTGTKGIWKPLAYAAGWSRLAPSYTALQYLKDEAGIVHLRGEITKAGAIPISDLITTMPVGARPETGGDGGQSNLTGIYVKSGVPVVWLGRVLDLATGFDGQVWNGAAIAGGIDILSLNGCSFYSPDV